MIGLVTTEYNSVVGASCFSIVNCFTQESCHKYVCPGGWKCCMKRRVRLVIIRVKINSVSSEGGIESLVINLIHQLSNLKVTMLLVVCQYCLWRLRYSYSFTFPLLLCFDFDDSVIVALRPVFCECNIRGPIVSQICWLAQFDVFQFCWFQTQLMSRTVGSAGFFHVSKQFFRVSRQQ